MGNITGKAAKASATLQSPRGDLARVSVAKRGPKAKAPELRTIRVPLTRADSALMVAFLSGDPEAARRLTVSPEPVAPTMPADDATAAEWRAYAIAKDEYPAQHDAWRADNATATRIRNAINGSLLGIPLRTRKAKA